MKFKIYVWVNEKENCYTTTWKENKNYIRMANRNEIIGYIINSTEHFLKLQDELSEKGYFIIDNEDFNAILC